MHKIVLPKFSEKIFKAYDIRGKYPEEINDDAAYKIARSHAMYLSLASGGKKLNIVVSSDDRPSSPALKKAFIEGLLREGAEVIDSGITTTPMHYFIVNKTNADGGAMITASHRPFEYNGIKLSKKEAVILGEGTGLTEIRNTALRGVFADKERGSVVEKNFKEEYFIFFEEKFSELKNFKIQIKADAKNSVEELFFNDLISRFPKFKVVTRKYDFGISFDRDGDRIKFTDEKGEEIAGDIITALLIKYFTDYLTLLPDREYTLSSPLSYSKRGGLGGELPVFIYSTNSSWAVKEEIEKRGGLAVESRVGHSFIKKSMRENNAVFGGELSGHYYFRDFFYCDSALFAMFCVTDLLRKEKKSLSELVAPILRYFATPELNFEVQNKDLYIDKAAASFHDGKISYLDGIKVDYSDWWFILRPSNTEDVVRLRIEAKTKKLLAEKKKRVLTVLGL